MARREHHCRNIAITLIDACWAALYSFAMAKTPETWLVIMLLTGGVAAQVKIIIPKRNFQPEEQIQAKLENQSSRPITVCVEFGQRSPKAGASESTPVPILG
jgi:hypothetical protein